MTMEAVLEISVSVAGCAPQFIRTPVRLPVPAKTATGESPAIGLKFAFHCEPNDIAAIQPSVSRGRDEVSLAPLPLSPAVNSNPLPLQGIPYRPDHRLATSAEMNGWYCRVGERVYGPITLDELISWAGQNRIWKQTPIRHGAEGQWFPAGECADLFTKATTGDSGELTYQTKVPKTGNTSKSPVHDDSPSHAAHSLIQSLNRGHRRTSTKREPVIIERVAIREQLRIHAKPIAAAIVAVFSAVLWLFPYPNPYAGILEQTQLTYNDFQQLRELEVDESRWKAFEEKTKTQFAAIVKELEKSAGPQAPASQHLLWAIRDYLPNMIHDARLERSRSEEQFARNVEAAQSFIHPMPSTVAASTN